MYFYVLTHFMSSFVVRTVNLSEALRVRKPVQWP